MEEGHAMPRGIYVSQLTPYLAAKTDAEEATAVRNIMRQIESGRGFNYWQSISNALVTDRAGTRDGQALVDAVGRAKPERQEAYALVADKWAQLAPWWDGGQHEKLPGVRVPLGNLEVRVPKLCGERRAGGGLEVLFPRWSRDALPRHVVFGVLRIVQLAHPDATEITFVDVPRLATYSSGDRDLTAYDSWLIQAGNDLAQLLPAVDDQAQAA
jgi:hypothetical protein